jgi:hypothetical protein
MSPTTPVALPFGKHRGEPLHDVPSGYLKWVLENLDRLEPDLKAALAAELRTRERRPRPATHEPTSTRPREPAPEPLCDVCGLPESAERPLVHYDCAGVPGEERVP